MNLTAIHSICEQQTLQITQSDENVLLIAEALRFLIENAFGALTSTYTTVISAHNQEAEQAFKDIMGRLYGIVTSMTVQMVLINLQKSQNIEKSNGKRYCNLLMVDSYQALV